MTWRDEETQIGFGDMADGEEYETAFLRHLNSRTASMDPSTKEKVEKKVFTTYNAKLSGDLSQPVNDCESAFRGAIAEIQAEARSFDKSHAGSYRDYIARADGISEAEANAKVDRYLRGETKLYHQTNKWTGGGEND